MNDSQNDKYTQIFIKGSGWSPEHSDCGQYGRIVQIDHRKPHPYAILYEGQTDMGFYLWIKREEFDYVFGRLSSWAALDAIEKCIDSEEALPKIKAILDQYKHGLV